MAVSQAIRGPELHQAISAIHKDGPGTHVEIYAEKPNQDYLQAFTVGFQKAGPRMDILADLKKSHSTEAPAFPKGKTITAKFPGLKHE